VETHAGSQTITEDIGLWAFLGGLQNNGLPAFEVLGQGYTPLDRRVVLSGAVRPDRAPYGEALSISIPAIPTLPLEPDASLVNFSLTIGPGKRTRDSNTVLVPSRCPAGGFPFAAEFTYADGSTGSAFTAVPCPRSATASAHVARSTNINETGHLHLVSKHGFTLNERSSMSGTFRGTIEVRLTAASTSRVTAEVTIHPSGGSISGYATAAYQMASATASFAGSLSIRGGAGSYVHAHGSGLSFSGTIQRSNDAVTVHIRGRVSD
jgi:hypothetical protein